MQDIIQKNDFIEIEFSGYLLDGTMFDTNNEKIAKENNLDIKNSERIFCVGQGFLVKGFDDALISKEIGKEYEIELAPNEAFGKRLPNLIKTMPIAAFHKHEINPAPGMSFFLDQYFVRISAVSGGRVITDFNNPLAGKQIKYKFRIIRKITDINEKIKALMRLFYKHEFEFSIDDKKLIINAKDIPFIEQTRQKWHEILGLEIDLKVKEEKLEKEEIESKDNPMPVLYV